MGWIWWLAVHVVALHAAILPPPWADPSINPCSAQPGGWLKLYWPLDGQCYRIFQKGSPCPETLELSPGPTGAECRCPPGQVQISADSPCYPIHTKGPCRKGHFLAPIQTQNRMRIGTCKQAAECPQAGDLFWHAEGQCYQEYSKGPCPAGQLLVHKNGTGLAECDCDAAGPLSRFYWPPTKTCHPFYTRGPCLEKGTLFLPGPQCGCHEQLPNFDKETELCYEIGGVGPCKVGQIFAGQPRGCICKPDHVPWLDGNCYRAYTRGPCKPEELLTEEGDCRPLPCPRGKLYFPDQNACHRVGVRGPCPRGHLVLFEQSVRPAVEGISYRGMCGCPGNRNCIDSMEPTDATSRSTQKEVVPEPTKVPRNAHINYSSATMCEDVEGEEICHQLYTQGPCQQGEWLVPGRHGRSRRRAKASKIPTSIGVYIGHRFNAASAEALQQQQTPRLPGLFQDYETNRQEKWRGRCECRPGYSPMGDGKGCHLPLVALAKFLNGRDYFE